MYVAIKYVHYLDFQLHLTSWLYKNRFSICDKLSGVQGQVIDQIIKSTSTKPTQILKLPHTSPTEDIIFLKKEGSWYFCSCIIPMLVWSKTSLTSSKRVTPQTGLREEQYKPAPVCQNLREPEGNQVGWGWGWGWSWSEEESTGTKPS